MNAAPFMKTPKEGNVEEIRMRKEYKANYLSEIYNIIIEMTNSNIIIRNTYYELKLSPQNLSLLTNIIFNSTNEAFEFIINIFNQNRYYIKRIFSNKILLGIQIYDNIKGQQKEIELELKENFEDKDYLIKELFNKYIRIEKDLNEVKYNNNILKDTNNKLNMDNANLKMELKSIKNNNNNSNNGLQMQISNNMNMINQLQQQLNQFSNIFQQINQIQNQINSLSMSMNNNSFNLNNQFSLNKNNQNNIQLNNNDKIPVIFRPISIDGKIIAPILIYCNVNDDIQTLFQKFRDQDAYYEKDIKFIFNAKPIFENLSNKIKYYGITYSANIFVVKAGINFKISNEYFYITPYILHFDREKKISELIQNFLDDTGFNSTDVKNYVYNNKNLNPNLTIKEIGIKNNSEILVNLHSKSSIKLINLIFQNGGNESEKIIIKCLKNEKFGSVKRKFEKITSNLSDNFKFAFDLREIDSIDFLKWSALKYKTLEDLGLKDNSVIIYSNKVKKF